jgi:hypothetical protein
MGLLQRTTNNLLHVIHANDSEQITLGHTTNNEFLQRTTNNKQLERFEKLARFLILLFSKIFQKRRSKTYSKL